MRSVCSTRAVCTERQAMKLHRRVRGAAHPRRVVSDRARADDGRAVCPLGQRRACGRLQMKAARRHVLAPRTVWLRLVAHRGARPLPSAAVVATAIAVRKERACVDPEPPFIARHPLKLQHKQATGGRVESERIRERSTAGQERGRTGAGEGQERGAEGMR